MMGWGVDGNSGEDKRGRREEGVTTVYMGKL